MSEQTQERAAEILQKVQAAGFDQVRVSIDETEMNELAVAHNHVSLMRSGSKLSLSLVGIQDQKKVSASVSSFEDEAVKTVIDGMVRDVAATPADPANGLTSGQEGSFDLGPQDVDREAMARSTKEFLAFREEKFPTFVIEEGGLTHKLSKTTLLSSGGTALQLVKGSYSASLLGSTKDEHGSSSFNVAGGAKSTLPSPLQENFDIVELMENSSQETQTEVLGRKFTGDVVLMPNAVSDLLYWLNGQLSDYALIQGSSVYKDSVGQVIASEKLTIRHITEGAGVSPFNGEGFLLEPFTLVENGTLNTLLPSYYGSRKLDLPHRPTGSGWEIVPGDVSKPDMLASVEKGALVGRLSMGSPAANGDFSGVIKNSFLIEGGKRTKALSETMISGNVAVMIRNILAISKETTDFGTGAVPWVRIGGLNFS